MKTMKFDNSILDLLPLKIHWVNGSPLYPGMQLHMGVWLTTWQFALALQESTQGFVHFWLIQASWLGHSLLLMHSGRQYGGEPENSGRQEHEAWSLSTWHWAFGPQGDGWQGFPGAGLGAGTLCEQHSWLKFSIVFFSTEVLQELTLSYQLVCIM